MKTAKIGVTVSFTFTLRKRIVLAETLDRPSDFEVDLEFQQATYEILEGIIRVDEKEAVKLAALQYCLQPLTAKLLTQMYIPKSLQPNHNIRVWQEAVTEKAHAFRYKANTTEEMDEIKRTYLKYAKRILGFGAESFKIANKGKLALPTELELSVNYTGLHLCEIVSKESLTSFKWGEFNNWEYDAENRIFSFSVKCAPPVPVISFESLEVSGM